MNYIDILIILIVGGFAFWGLKRGIIKTVFSLVSFFLAIILTMVFIVPFTGFMENTGLSGAVKEPVYAFVMGKDMPKDKETETVEQTAEELQLPEFMRAEVVKLGMDFMEDATVATKQATAQATAQVVFNVLCGVILYLLMLVVLHLLKFFLAALGKLPGIRQLNHMFGGVFGALNGILVVYILLGVISFFVSAGNAEKLGQDINGSAIGGYMYNNNVIMELIS